VGPAGSRQRHYFYLPEGHAPDAAEGATFEAPQYRVLQVEVAIGASGSQEWSVQLVRGPRIL
jgi:hypothetical protein